MHEGQSSRPRPEAILIAGPTAVGKSALAVEIARRFDGTIVNTDSMQVYRDLCVVSARPDASAMAQAPHRLYGEIDGAVNFSVGAFSRQVTTILAEIGAEGRLPIFVGGTGLYFKALIEGLSELPAVPDAVREALRREAEGRSTAALHADLAERDPVGAARLRPSDRQRVLRALEVHEATGRPLAAFQGNRLPGPLAGRPLLKLVLTIDRDALRRRIDARFVAMCESGVLDEISRLADRRLDPLLPVMRAVGVPPLLAHLGGDISLEVAIERGQGDSRRYAKRQLTWFRNQMGEDWIRAEPEEAAAILAERLSAPTWR